MNEPLSAWPYAPTLARLALAMAIGLFVGVERERQHKEAGIRTFAFVAILGAVGGMLGAPFALAALALVGLLVIFLNVEAIRTGAGAEITTSAALLVTAFAGILAGQGQAFTPTALGVATAALLAWKGRMAGFSRALTETEFSSAILFAILAFVVYPTLPEGTVDPWHLIDPRAVWITVILVAALGFGNYVLLKLYGTRGIEFAGFLGGLLNSTATVAELAARTRATAGLGEPAYRAVLLATAAMLLRNAVILGLLAPAAFAFSLLPHVLMLGLAAAPVVIEWRRRRHAATAATPGEHARGPLPGLGSPFTLVAALQFGLIFLALQVAGILAQRTFGDGGFYGVSLVGGLISSASAVASAANLAASRELSPQVAATGAIIASAMSALINLVLTAHLGRDRALTRRVAWTIVGVTLVGVAGSFVVGQLTGPDLAALLAHLRGLLGR